METIQISSSPEFKKSLKKWAFQASMTVSEFVRSACHYYVENVLPKIKKSLK